MNELKKILCPIDFSDNSEKILQSAVFFAKKFEATLHAVFVVQSFDDYAGFYVPHIPIASFMDEMIQGAEKKLGSFMAPHVGAEIPCTEVVLYGDVADEIVRYAEKAAIDLIIMGTHGYKGLEKALFGSVAEKVVKTAGCPVLTINPYK